MHKIEIRFSPERKSEKTRIRDAASKMCENGWAAGCEVTSVDGDGDALVMACNVQDTSQSWPAMQDYLTEKDLLAGTTVFAQMEENEPLTKIYPVTNVG